MSLGRGGFGSAVGDLTGDGKPDLVVGGTVVLLNNADGTFRAQALIPATQPGLFTGPAIGDFDADGMPDLLSGSPILF